MEEMANQSQETITEEVSTETTQETTIAQSTENTTQQTEQAVQDTETPKQTIKVKYNSEEKELPVDEAIILAQKGMNYEKAVERARQEARDAMIADYGYEWQGKPITTEAEYKQALKEKEVYDKLSTQNIPQEVIDEVLEGRKTREQLAKIQQDLSFQETYNSELREFKEAYPDVAPDATLPPAVIDLIRTKGLTLLDAYNRVVIPEKLAKMQQALGVKQKNSENATTSPGSVTGLGATIPDFISEEVFNQNKGDQRWIIKHFSKIQESRSKW